MAEVLEGTIWQDIVETIREPLVVLDSDLRIVFANRSFYATFKVQSEETLGQHIYDLGNKQWNIPSLRELLENMLPRNHTFNDYEVAHDFDDIGRRTMLLNARRVKQGMDKRPVTLLAIEDITERSRLENLLIDSEERFRRLYETAEDGILLLRKGDGTIDLVNPSVERILGYSSEECIGKDLRDVGVLHDMGDIHQVTKMLDTQGIIRCDDIELKTKTGKSIHAEMYFVDKAKLIQCNIRDITRRKQNDSNLKQSRSRVRTLIDTLPDLVWLKDQEGVYLNCNHAFELFFGTKESEIIGRTDYDFVDEERADFFRKHDQKALEANSPSANEEELTFAATGYKGIFETVKTPMYDADNNLIGVLGIARDITQHKRAQQALLESERKWKDVVNSSPQIGLSLDTEGRIVFVNDYFQKHTGYTSSEVIGKNWFDLFIPENIREEMRHVYSSTMRQVSVTGFSTYANDIILKSGELRHIFWSNVITKDTGGNIIDVTSLGIDLTERRRAEDERINLTNQLMQAQKMESIGTLAGGIAHDFNNILSSILGFTELALDEAEKNSSMEENLQEVYSAGQRAKELVKQILAFARQSDEDIKPLKPRAIAEEITHLLRSSIPSTIQINQQFESDACIMGNPTQLHQIIMNLCTNAAHSMEDTVGRLTISIKDIDGDKIPVDKQDRPLHGKYVQLRVTDTGTGISPDIIDSIFEPYFTTKKPGQGTGMGLAMVQGIVESYGGQIGVESSMGQGSTFTIYLPITRESKTSPDYQPEILPTGSERILVVDDEPQIANLTRMVLERLGYDVTTRVSSTDALELFKARSADFDVIITDMTMPDMTGDILALEIMKIRADIPVILCTGYSSRISEETAHDIGIKAFVYKPFVKADLARTVRKVLDGNRTSQS